MKRSLDLLMIIILVTELAGLNKLRKNNELMAQLVKRAVLENRRSGISFSRQNQGDSAIITTLDLFDFCPQTPS